MWMWRWKTWPRWSRRTRGALALLCLVAFLGLGWPVQAQGSIQVISSRESAVFSQALNFSLEAKSSSPIVEVVLFYGLADTPLVRRIYPKFARGTQVRIEHEEKLESGQYAPGALMRTWWQLRASDGSTLTTPPKTFEYTDDKRDWRKLAGKSVDLYWYGRDEAKARDLLGRADRAVAKLESDIGVALAQQVKVYVYNSANDMRPALSRRSEGYDDRVTTLGVAIDEKTLLLLGTHRDVNQTIAHELSHIVVGIATDNPYTELPRWLDEGLAMYAEGVLPADNKDALEKAVRADKLPSIRSMTSYSGQASQVDLFYGAAFSVVDFMLKQYGREKMRQLLAVFTEGTRQDEALRRVYGLGLDDLDTTWRASLGLKPRQRHATPAPKGTPQPRAGIGLGSPLGGAAASGWLGFLAWLGAR